jgi:two-component system sensor histidine kinase/response regulator
MPNRSDVAGAAHRKRALWMLALLWTLALAAAVSWWIRERADQQEDQVRNAANLRAAGLRDTLGVALRQLAALPSNVARRPASREALLGVQLPDLSSAAEPERIRVRTALLRERSVRAANAMLSELMRDFGLPLALLLDRQGNVVADGGSGRALATNLRHRAYFTDAVSHGTASQFLVGRTSRDPGIYFSARVDADDGSALGVVVMKQDTGTLNRLFTERAAGPLELVADEHGVVVLGSRTPLLGHRLPAWLSGEPPAEGWQVLYQAEPVPLGWSVSPREVDDVMVPIVDIGGAPHVASSVRVPGHPFTAWVLAPLADGAPALATIAAGALTAWLAGLLLLWGFGRRIENLESALRARRELSDLAQALPLTVFRYLQPERGPGRFLFLGDGVERVLGVDPKALERDPALPWRLARDPQERPPSEPVEFAVPLGTRTVWVRSHSVPMAARGGAVVHNGYWLDVTDRREAETRFSAVLEHAPSGYLFFDRRRGVTHCNPATVRMFGAADAGQLRGRVPWFPGMSPPVQADGRPSRERALELMRRHFGTHERVQSFEWRFQRADGSAFDADVNVIALDGGLPTEPASGHAWEGEPEFCAVLTDISARKATEQAMQEARAAAEAASRTKTSFLANMSHELRTPMNAIIGMTHLALEDGLPPRQRGYVEKAHGAARNLLQILDDILDVSKVEAGHLALERIEFTLDAVVAQMADVLGLKAEEKGLALLFRAAPGLPERLVGDPTRLRQVMVNLGSNAIKFTDQGEVTLGIEPVAQDDREVELHVWVRDTGIGLDAEQQSRIFQPFMQADNSTTRRFGGTGLGLTISRQLVERMGGRLWVDSAPGRGSTFHFTARFGRAAAGEQAADRPAQTTPPNHMPAPAPHPAALQLASPPSAMADRRRLAGTHVLLVEDHPLNQELARALLERAGMRVSVAADGAQALAALEREGPFDGVLMDCQMPVMDGYDATRRLRADPRWRELPVIAMTASALAADRDRALAAGMNAHIAKPLDVDLMFRTLAQWLRPSSPPPATADAPPPLPADLAALHTLDAQDGLKRCSGNESLYRRLLRAFADAQAGFEQTFQSARASGDWARAEHVAHDLKGLAGNLGARALHAAAATLQQACQGKDDAGCSAALAETVKALQPVLDEIRTLDAAYPRSMRA